MVERLLAKEKVVGSIPISRSKTPQSRGQQPPPPNLVLSIAPLERSWTR